LWQDLLIVFTPPYLPLNRSLTLLAILGRALAEI
jgi:hypothetical protein